MFAGSMPLNNIHTICICGAGTMGSGIVQVAALAGYKTIQYDISDAMVDKSRQNVYNALQKLVEKNKISRGQLEQAFSLIVFTSSFSDCKADLVIEAVVEKKEIKIDLFNRLAAINKPDTIFATNTSSISVGAIAAACNRPGMVAGMHFFNPAPLMKLVEIVAAPSTSAIVVETLTAIAKKMGKSPVICTDAPGFIVNRVARHYYLEALRLVENDAADIETIDVVMEAAGFKMGPFKLMDLIGIDINYSVSHIVWEALGKPERLTPSALQKQKKEAGDLGRKTGRGFYRY